MLRISAQALSKGERGPPKKFTMKDFVLDNESIPFHPVERRSFPGIRVYY